MEMKEYKDEYLDIDLVSEEFYSLLIDEAKKTIQDKYNIEDTSSKSIVNMRIIFDVENN